MTTETATIFHTLTAPREIPENRVRDLICGAFEGGAISCWVAEVGWELREGLKIEDFATNLDAREGRRYTDQGSEAARIAPGEYWPRHYLVPFSEGCTLIVQDNEEEDDAGQPVVYRVTRESMQRALELMAKNHLHHFNDFMEENDDAETSDVFFQLACMGEVIYG